MTTKVVTLKFEVSEELARVLHETLCLVIHELNPEAITQLANGVVDVELVETPEEELPLEPEFDMDGCRYSGNVRPKF